MKFSVLVIAVALGSGEASELRGAQPIFKGSVNNNAKFAVSAQGTKPARPPNYRSAWDDCGGVGASATERMRTIASKIKGWAKPLPFVRHAAQDCGSIHASGTKPGPGKAIVYPGPEIPATIRDGLSTAAKTLAKYPAVGLVVKKQPIFKGKVNNNAKFAVSAQGSKPARPPNYRSAWDDCGGVGASATERMRTIASKIKGWAKPLPFVRHAAQDCGSIHASGTKPGPGKAIVYPGPEIPATIRDGLSTAAKTLAKYPAVGLVVKKQPIFKGKVNNNAKFAVSAQGSKPARPPNYRSAWDDCGGVGASATERMRTIASKIKGWAKPLPFVRHAAQDCGSIHASGTKPGPGKAIVYPGPEIPATIRDGLSTAAKTLAKYPAVGLVVKKQPIFKGKVNSNAKFAVSAQGSKPARPPNYRSAWDDCGGVGASATERMRTIASKIKGWAKPLPFVRHAAQDCGSIHSSGTKPGPGKAIVYPGPEIPATIRDGLSTAAKTLAKYPAATK